MKISICIYLIFAAFLPSINSELDIKHFLEIVQLGEERSLKDFNFVIQIQTLQHQIQTLHIPKSNASKPNYEKWPYNPLQLWNEEVLAEASTSGNISEQCEKDVNLFNLGLTTGQPWAWQMIDATGKPIPSVSKGLRWLGDYDSCLATNVSGIVARDGFKTQTVNILLILPLGLPSVSSVSICVPETCSPAEIVELIQVANPERPPELTYPGLAANAYREPYSAGAIVLITILSVLCAMTVVGTFIDMFLVVDKKGASLWLRLLLLFSLYSNTVKLFHVSDASDNNLLVIHGIRFFSATWVVLGHACSDFTFRNFWQVEFFQEMKVRWTNLGVVAGEFAVDTFFLLSGTMVAYTMMRQLTTVGGPKKFGWSWLQYYVHRYWRLTPSMMLILGISTCLFQYFGDGSMWSRIGEDTVCNKNWWTNLLYINNLKTEGGICFAHTWYLALDMQFYILSPLFLIPLYSYWPLGVGAIMATMLGCSIASGVLSAQYGAPMGGIGNTMQPLLYPDYFDTVYIVPWFRIGPYLVGLLLGFLLHKTKLQMKLHWGVVTLGWSLATAIALSIVYGPYSLLEGNYPSTELAALFNSTARTTWAACVAWVIFACTHGYGGYVNELLSWKAFVPLSRLSYMLYLVHLSVLQVYFDTRRQLNTMDNFQMILLYLGLLVLSYMVSYVCSMILEVPLAGFEKVLLSRKSKPQTDRVTNEGKNCIDLTNKEEVMRKIPVFAHDNTTTFAANNSFLEDNAVTKF